MSILVFSVMRFSQQGTHFEAVYSVYDDAATAMTVCEQNNEYVETNHPTEDVIYKVVTIEKNRSSIF